jgi:cystathionine beta-lyase/cystathionine gamma-synthase
VLGGEQSHPFDAFQPPIFQTTNFRFDRIEDLVDLAEGKRQHYLYTRYANPTLEVVERKIAALEEGEAGLVFSSGMAAMSSALLTLVGAGDHLLASNCLYGGTYYLLRDFLPRFGVEVEFISLETFGEIGRLFRPNTRLLLVESPTNPTIRLLPLEEVAAAARRRGVLSLIDNTFATPVNQKPLLMGWDVVMHSATKYLGGHSDVTAGVLVARKDLIQRVEEHRRRLGGVLDPSAAYLLLRGMKTLHLRVAQQNRNALALARFLAAHSAVESVHYPFLETHPEHALAKRQMRGGGGVLAFAVKGGWEAAKRFFNGLKLVPISSSLGGVESLVTSPCWTSHYGLSEAELRDAGVSLNLVRMSVGVESVDDLCADLDQALRRAAPEASDRAVDH